MLLVNKKSRQAGSEFLGSHDFDRLQKGDHGVIGVVTTLQVSQQPLRLLPAADRLQPDVAALAPAGVALAMIPRPRASVMV
ncbi:hypothetical protein A6033_04590 [Aeromonas veronii]|nr:hypothetical protein A6033_04590 [Aeromonas veronii]